MWFTVFPQKPSSVNMAFVPALPISAIVSISSSAVIVFLQLIFITSLIYSFCCSKAVRLKRATAKTKIPKAMIIALGTFTCLATAFIDWIIEEYLFRKYGKESVLWQPLFISFFAFIAMSWVCFYIFMLLRLRTTFDDTDFQVKSKVFRAHIIAIILIPIIGAVCVFLERWSFNDNIYFGVAAVLTILCGIACLHLVYLFNSKLFNLTIQIRHSQSEMSRQNSRDRGNNNQAQMAGLKLGERQLKMLVTIRKQTLLGCTIVLMLLISAILIVVHAVWDVIIVWFVGWCFTMNVGSLCIYLGFSVNRRQYLCICKHCDSRCMDICNNMVEKKVKLEKVDDTEMNEVDGKDIGVEVMKTSDAVQNKQV